MLEFKNTITGRSQLFVMGNHDRRQPTLGLKFAQQLQNLVPGSLIEISGRLICQKQPRPIDEGARKRNPLLLTTRELSRAMPRP